MIAPVNLLRLRPEIPAMLPLSLGGYTERVPYKPHKSKQVKRNIMRKKLAKKSRRRNR